MERDIPSWPQGILGRIERITTRHPMRALAMVLSPRVPHRIAWRIPLCPSDDPVRRMSALDDPRAYGLRIEAVGLPFELAGRILCEAYAASVREEDVAWPPAMTDEFRERLTGMASRARILRWYVLRRFRALRDMAEVCRDWYGLIYNEREGTPIWRDLEHLISHRPQTGWAGAPGFVPWRAPLTRVSPPSCGEVRRDVMRYMAGGRRSREWFDPAHTGRIHAVCGREPDYATMFVHTWGFLLRPAHAGGFLVSEARIVPIERRGRPAREVLGDPLPLGPDGDGVRGSWPEPTEMLAAAVVLRDLWGGRPATPGGRGCKRTREGPTVGDAALLAGLSSRAPPPRRNKRARRAPTKLSD